MRFLLVYIDNLFNLHPIVFRLNFRNFRVFIQQMQNVRGYIYFFLIALIGFHNFGNNIPMPLAKRYIGTTNILHMCI